MILAAGFFSGSETALSYCNRIRMKTLAENGDKRAKRVAAITDDFDNALITLLIGTNVAQIVASAVATVVSIGIFSGLPAIAAYASVFSTVLLTLAVFIFAETLPKNIAIARADSISLVISGPVLVMMRIMTPFTFVFGGICNLAKRLMRRTDDVPTMTEDEFTSIIDDVEDDGGLEPEEGRIIRSAIEFGDLAASDVMTARDDVAYLNIDAGRDAVRSEIIESRHSRMPVCHGTLDRIIGVVSVSDCLWRMMNGAQPDVRSIMKSPFTIPPAMRLDALFEEMERRRTHMAIVSDSGKVVGIITMEDILEQLVGEIYDEEEPAPEETSEDESTTYDKGEDAAREGDDIVAAATDGTPTAACLNAEDDANTVNGTNAADDTNTVNSAKDADDANTLNGANAADNANAINGANADKCVAAADADDNIVIDAAVIVKDDAVAAVSSRGGASE